MSLEKAKRAALTKGFPRVSGDEPTLLVKLPLKTEFSPRERG